MGQLLKKKIDIFLNSKTIECQHGLNGKMAVSIHLFHLFRNSRNKEYSFLARQLLNEVCGGINLESSPYFSDGIAGIGWGLNYLNKKKFITTNTDDILLTISQLLKPHITNTRNTNSVKRLLDIGIYFFSQIKDSLLSERKIDRLFNVQQFIYILEELCFHITGSLNDWIENDGAKMQKKLNRPIEFRWEYVYLTIFLENIYHLRLYSFRERDLFSRLVHPLLDLNQMPKNHYQRLLLIMVLEKIRFYKSDLLPKNFSTALLEKIKIGLTRQKIYEPLKQNKKMLYFHARKIAYIYNELFIITKNIIYKHEYFFWISQSLNNYQDISPVIRNRNTKIDTTERLILCDLETKLAFYFRDKHTQP